MKTIELDLTGCKYLSDIHERIRIAFDSPSGMGQTGMHFGICCAVNVIQIS